MEDCSGKRETAPKNKTGFGMFFVNPAKVKN